MGYVHEEGVGVDALLGAYTNVHGVIGLYSKVGDDIRIKDNVKTQVVAVGQVPAFKRCGRAKEVVALREIFRS